MARKSKCDSPRVFISYAWKDQPVSKRLQQDLERDGVELFVDYQKITGGDSLPAHISAALAWCNTLVLLWSPDAAQSYYVSKEWESAFHLQRRIIPCVLDGKSLPALLQSHLYLDFSSYQSGYTELCASLGVRPGILKKESSQQPIRKELLREKRTRRNSILEAEKRIVLSKKLSKTKTIQLRSQPVGKLSVNSVRKMLRERDFFASDWNPRGKGIRHQYEAIEFHGGTVVISLRTGLIWQHSGPKIGMNYERAKSYIDQLKRDNFGGYDDWRLPTLEEAMSLMEREKKTGLYLHWIFGQAQKRIWTADKESKYMVWGVYFKEGNCRYGRDNALFVRAVRLGV